MNYKKNSQQLHFDQILDEYRSAYHSRGSNHYKHKLIYSKIVPLIREKWPNGCQILEVACGSGENKSSATTTASQSVLNRIETFKPAEQKKETYDYNLADNNPLPKSMADVLVYDIWMTMTRKIQVQGVNQSNLTISNVLEVLNYYKNNASSNLIGFRPYTNSSFIKSLNNDEINELAKEIVVHIKERGVWEKPKQ